jgi:signal transduction histidine kinase
LQLIAVSPSPRTPVQDQDRQLQLRLGRGLAGWVAETRQAVLVPDLRQDDRWVNLPGEDQPGAAIAVPLQDRDQVLGALIVVAERELGNDDLQLMQGIGRQVSLALTNAQRYRQVTRRLAERTALQQVAQVVSRRLEIGPLLEEVVRQVSQVLGYPLVEVWLVEGEALLLRAANLQESLEHKRLRLDAGIIGRAVRVGQAVFVADVGADPDYVVGFPNTRSEIAVPLYSGEIVVGVLNVESPEERGLTPEDLHLLTLVGDQVSVALENAALVERLRRHTEELQETVAERTAELQQALEVSLQADQLKTRFVADVSHELRTPLTNIRLYLDLLEKGRSEKFADYLETLHRETGRLVDLIEDLLMVSRLDADTADLEPSWIDLNSMAHSLVEDRRRLVAQMDLTIGLETQADLPLVRADERMIAQVVANLLTNAVNYTPPGGSVTVRTDTIGDGETKWARLSVADTGVGIPENELPRLFERFFRGSASRIRNVSGTGLGLAICKEILDRHGGRITSASRSGEGSTFTIWLPVQKATEFGEVRPAAA